MTDDQDLPPGFVPFALHSAYLDRLGRLLVDEEAGRLAMQATPNLANVGGVIHGGALATFADIAMFVIACGGQPNGRMVTITLNTAFLAPAPVDAFLVAEGRVSREGRSVVFVDGTVTADGEPVLTFAGTLKRVRER